MTEYIILGVIFIGFLHGLEPGHGWPLALIYSVKKSKIIFHAFISSSIISFFHFFSAIVVVILFLLINFILEIPVFYFKIASSIILTILAIRFFFEKQKEEIKIKDISLKNIATAALFLGFAHEEEIMILGFVLTGIDPWILIISYSLAVTTALIGITLISIKIYEKVFKKLKKFEKHIPKISGIILLIIALMVLL